MDVNSVRERESETAGVKSAVRTLAIFDLLAEEPNGLTMAQIRERLSLPRSSAHVLIRTLVERGYLVYGAPGVKRLRLGIRLVQLGLSVADQLDLRKAAGPALEHLVEVTHETAYLAVPTDGELTHVERRVSDKREIRADLRLGARRPLHCTSLGKALLASLDDASALAIVREMGLRPVTQFSLTTEGSLLAQLAYTRRQGYAVDRQEAVIGVCCVGAPVRDGSGHPVAAVSVATIREYFDPDHVGPATRDAAVSISRALGWSGDAATLYEPVPDTAAGILGRPLPESPTSEETMR